ncbi:23S rRNA (guanosine(2251)-2'-O)-methyltransferase RlmB [Salinisphaera hydrothermalis]|uniref:23S rRNA (Guanosine-2'-O-)-methyltransferase rlmB n=1 Tax=Salinisphaera hydrothermalis (strain C41B8) TaxID=1304275 RepID=A0A084IGZ5_SALHC|nr:23S rRNA (guanosine(2251)-2'-O)-methyltransferase RlmB [Salinisphaera hydrothermalis]KEZ75979.1 23S rRNA (guanosine-2'-O-) -methyltransferase rlmB [Salinisphaera hydrothermalis C41B8]
MSQNTSDNERIGGFHAVVSALEAGRPIRRLWLAEGRRGGRADELAARAEAAGVPVEMAPMSRLDAWLPEVRHQGCIAEVEPPQEYRESELPELLHAVEDPWVLALDQVQDPHNLGACLRSAAAAGVTAVIAPRKRAAGLTASVRKVAAGAAERVPFVPVTNLSRALKRLQDDGFWVVGLDGTAEVSLYDAELPRPLVWVAGGEAKGMRELTAKHCDLRVSIPMAAGMESLNVSVATGVALFETVRQRR